jgi:hypothetical protein
MLPGKETRIFEYRRLTQLLLVSNPSARKMSRGAALQASPLSSSPASASFSKRSISIFSCVLLRRLAAVQIPDRPAPTTPTLRKISPLHLLLNGLVKESLVHFTMRDSPGNWTRKSFAG